MIWEYETSSLFTEAERAALRIAQGSGSVPNGATDEMFAAAREHYTDDQLAAIVAVASFFFGYLNRWNDTIADHARGKPDDPSATPCSPIVAGTPGNHA